MAREYVVQVKKHGHWETVGTYHSHDDADHKAEEMENPLYQAEHHIEGVRTVINE